MRAERGRIGVAALTVAAVICAPPAVWAYVRTRAPENCRVLMEDPVNGCREIAWSKTAGSCIPVTIYMDGFTDMTPDEVAKSIAAAAHAWSPSNVTCPGSGDPTHPFLEIVPSLASLNAKKPSSGDDKHNAVMFRSDPFMEPNVIALTTVFNKKDSRILDADVEINAAEFRFANLDPGFAGTPRDFIDLQAAITHEFGHFLGLGHTCFDSSGSDEVRPIDHLGNEVPDCTSSAAENANVMSARVNPGDIQKRMLSADDVAGVCTIYPMAEDPRYCALDLPDDGCGCATGGPGAGGTVLAVALLALVRTGRARRGRRAPTLRPASTRR